MSAGQGRSKVFCRRHQRSSRILLLIFLSLLFSASRVDASSVQGLIKEGVKLYNDEQFEQAEEKFQLALENDPESAIINFNLATAQYKLGLYDKSLEHFQKGLLTEDPGLKQSVYFNLGNASYQLGLANEDIDIEKAIQQLEDALRYYNDVLAMTAREKDAQANKELVEKELERLRNKKKMQEMMPQNEQQSGQQPQQGAQQESSQQNNNQPNSQGGDGEDQKQTPSLENGSSAEQNAGGQNEKGQDQSAADNKTEDSQNGGGSSGQGQEKNNANAQDNADQKNIMIEELTEEEAKQLLRNYQLTEEPDKLLVPYKPERDLGPVGNDW